MTKKKPKRLWLEAGAEPVGYGALGREILVSRKQDDAKTKALTGKLLDTHTSAIILVDENDMTPICEALDWMGTKMTRYHAPLSFQNTAIFEQNFISSLYKYCGLKRRNQTFDRYGEILQTDIESNLKRLSIIFNRSSGFNLDFVRLQLKEPIWHVDLSRQTIPASLFVRAIRCPHQEKGPWIALKEKTKTKRIVDTEGRASIHYDVSQYAQAGAGLNILRGDCVHSTPVLSDDQPRTIYTLTPQHFLNRDMLLKL